MAFGESAHIVGDLLRYSSATIFVVVDPDPGVNWTDVGATFVGLAAALTVYTVYVELVSWSRKDLSLASWGVVGQVVIIHHETSCNDW